MTIEELLSQILGGGQAPVNRMAGNWNGPDAEPNRMLQPQAPMPQAQAPAMAPAAMQAQGAPMQAQPQQAPAAAPQASGGGILERLFGGGQSSGENQTIAWLQKEGLDPGTAVMMAKHKPSLQAYLLERAQGGDPLKRLQAEKLGLEVEQMRNPKRSTTTINDKLVYTDTGEVVGDYGDPEVQTRTMTPEEVTAAGLAPGVWQIDKDNKISKAGDAAPVKGGAFRFEGTSVEAQALNGLMDSGALNADQAQQLAAGKTVTNPADGSIIFLTPRGIFSQPATGGAAQPLGPAGPAPERSAVPSVPPVVSTAPAPVVPPPAAAPAPVAAPAVAPPAPVDQTALPAPRQGVIQLTEGKPGKLATEAETKNRALYTVAAPELQRVEDNFASLSNVYDQAASGLLPWGRDNYTTSPEFQRATNALTNLAQTYLYAMSGQAAPVEEVNKIVRSVTPMPGESKESVADKRARLKDYVKAIRQAGGNWTPPPADAPPPPASSPGAPAPGGVDPSSATPDTSGWSHFAPGVKIRKKAN